jgi:hypothetical protein
MTQRIVPVLVSAFFAIFLAGCGLSTVRNYAALLAADTGRLNDEFEQLTKSRQQIDATRDNLTDLLELSTLTAENYNQRRLAEWEALKEDGNAFGVRSVLFAKFKAHSDDSANREATINALAAKVVDMRFQAKAQRSEQLAETVKHLAALSKQPDLKEGLSFLANYAKGVQESIKSAKEDAQKAAESAKRNLETVSK